MGAEGPAGRVVEGASCRFLGELGCESALSAALSWHFHCLLSVILSVSQQAESVKPWGWGRLPKA